MTQPTPTGHQSMQALFDLAIRFEGVLDALGKGFPSPIPQDQLKQMSDEIIALRHAVNDYLNPPYVTQQEVRDILEKANAVIVGSHFVYKSGLHGPAYVNKDVVYPDVFAVSRICRGLAEHFRETPINVVVAPEKGGIILSHWTAYHLSLLTGRRVFAAYAEKNEVVIFSPESDQLLFLSVDDDKRETHLVHFGVMSGDQVVSRGTGFSFKRGYESRVSGMQALVVEDILTTGGSAKETAKTTRKVGGVVVGVGAICNQGNVAAEQIDVPELFSLLNIKMDSWLETECPLCEKGIPVNIDLGHGKEFLARRVA